MPCNCDGMTTPEEDIARMIRTEIAGQYPWTKECHSDNAISDICDICRRFQKEELKDIKISYAPGLLKWYEMHLVQDIEFNMKELARISGETINFSRW